MFTLSLLFVLAQCMHTGLLRAAQGGSVTLVRLLLEKYGSSVDEAEKVSTEVLPTYVVTASEMCSVLSVKLCPVYISMNTYMYLHNTHIPTQTHSQSQISTIILAIFLVCHTV